MGMEGMVEEQRKQTEGLRGGGRRERGVGRVVNLQSHTLQAYRHAGRSALVAISAST